MTSTAKRPHEDSPNLYDFRLFQAMCGIVDARKVGEPKPSLRGVHQSVKQLGWNVSYPTVLNCLDRMERFFNVDRGGLLTRDGDCEFAPLGTGREAYGRVQGILAAVDNAQASMQPNLRVQILTPNIYELHCLVHVMPMFIASLGERIERTMIEIREITHVNQGMELLRDGETLMLDGSPAKPLGDHIRSMDLRIDWKRVVLIPRNASEELKACLNGLELGTNRWVSASDLVDVPLCYVVGTGTMDFEVRRRAKAPRLVFGTTEAMQRFVAESRDFVGLSINWTRLWGEGYEKRFKVRFVKTSLPNLHMWLTHSVDWDGTSPHGVLAGLIGDFFAAEKEYREGRKTLSRLYQPDQIDLSD